MMYTISKNGRLNLKWNGHHLITRRCKLGAKAWLLSFFSSLVLSFFSLRPPGALVLTGIWYFQARVVYCVLIIFCFFFFTSAIPFAMRASLRLSDTCGPLGVCLR
ncbi:hypothetical protein ASPFODRAFT_497380 [Aspergillus luchuensis CBS 106.47]|uniref:Uncharacterized protein n=1 Tax=Aspergillus luchuensis (strain CBS 106.47) TaxID=1137211 RepID=A0A1M3TRW8_ASPLC|nr:hypothetical protein ASPFODRAFT_497380 [Aspergillus luchuensis CBS 106.47]